MGRGRAGRNVPSQGSAPRVHALLRRTRSRESSASCELHRARTSRLDAFGKSRPRGTPTRSTSIRCNPPRRDASAAILILGSGFWILDSGLFNGTRLWWDWIVTKCRVWSLQSTPVQLCNECNLAKHVRTASLCTSQLPPTAMVNNVASPACSVPATSCPPSGTTSSYGNA